jgi:predicted DNA-binding transcriptional regulator AlpA
MLENEKYLTTKELSALIKYGQQTIYNLIHDKKLVKGIHYVKPTPKKLLFRWSEMQAWLGEVPSEAGQILVDESQRKPSADGNPSAGRAKSKICI